jgi:hypothetical protein
MMGRRDSGWSTLLIAEDLLFAGGVVLRQAAPGSSFYPLAGFSSVLAVDLGFG